MTTKEAANQSELHKNHRQRLKRQYLSTMRGVFTDHQILEILLFHAVPREDTNPLAHLLLNRFGSLANIFEASLDQLKEVPGVGDQTAFLLHFIPELTRRYLISLRHPGSTVHLNSTEDLQYYVSSFFLGDREHECLMYIGVNSQHNIVKYDFVQSMRQEVVLGNYMKFMHELNVRNVSNIFVAHFHPDGTLMPSEDDINITNLISTLAHTRGLNLCDHILCTPLGSISCCELAGSPGFPFTSTELFSPMFRSST